MVVVRGRAGWEVVVVRRGVARLATASSGSVSVLVGVGTFR
jgi:hypothetical protein